jgi:type I restriction enzyme M protein
MAIKKSELYSSLWASCDELRGGMDASQYKDYVLFMLFIKYISDKYAESDDFAPAVTIPTGSSFKDMLDLRGKDDIGEKINTQIIQPLIDANSRLARSDFPDFNDPNKLGEGKAKVDRLTNLINIFNSPALDFSKNRADHDDILGDAYEYLMRHFATESGKSKGQFYTPSEVSRILAKVIGISSKNSVAATTAYDPTCGSGSLLLKVAAEAGKKITLEGQEMDVTTSGLARMNMILHDFPTANIMAGNTISNPKFLDGNNLRTYDYVVANPPFSDKTWSTGIVPSADSYKRFEWGTPPAKQGDYAYLLHIIRSMKSTGKAACILPHGVLFRGNAEAGIRRKLIQSGFLKGIIGLPPNLFYGTGIAACILVLDKENAHARKGVFMIDASKGFMKDGNKNRLREQDIHKIVDVFTKMEVIDKFSRMIPIDEIIHPKNDCNLNIPRYIDSAETEDIQDIEAHLCGGIPQCDIDALDDYWNVLPNLRKILFKKVRPAYFEAKVKPEDINHAIVSNKEFQELQQQNTEIFDKWKKDIIVALHQFNKDSHPKDLIELISEKLLVEFKKAKLIDPYDVYQHLMDFWNNTMQDDAYLIAADGWKAETRRVIEEVKAGKNKGEIKDKGWVCDLLPKEFIVNRFFSNQRDIILTKQAELEQLDAELQSLLDDNGGEDGVLKDVTTKLEAESIRNELMLSLWNEEYPKEYAKHDALLKEIQKLESQLTELRINEFIVKLRDSKGMLKTKTIKERLQKSHDDAEKNILNSFVEYDQLLKENNKLQRQNMVSVKNYYISQLSLDPLPEKFSDLYAVVSYIEKSEIFSELKSEVKSLEIDLDFYAYAKYPELSESEIQLILIKDKWLPFIQSVVVTEMDNISHRLTQRIKELADRYETPMPTLTDEVHALEEKVHAHLQNMGFVWK